MINNAILGVIASGRPYSSTPVACDPYYNYVVALLHLNDTPGPVTTVDDEIGPKTWTAVSAEIVTDQFVFGGRSVYLPNLTSYLMLAADTDLVFGTSEFSVQMWIRPSNVTGLCIFFDMRNLGINVSPHVMLYISSGQLGCYVNGSVTVSGGSVSTGAWYFVELSRVAGVTTLYLNGATIGAWADSTNYALGPCYIGTTADSPGLGGFQGHVDDIRVTNGEGRNGSVPTEQFPDTQCP